VLKACPLLFLIPFSQEQHNAVYDGYDPSTLPWQGRMIATSPIDQIHFTFQSVSRFSCELSFQLLPHFFTGHVTQQF
jgi:hypothetical protein